MSAHVRTALRKMCASCKGRTAVISRTHFGLPLITCVRCHVCTTASETEALALPVCEFGTVCHVACEHLTSATDILKHY